jgi:hypothetical protein
MKKPTFLTIWLILMSIAGVFTLYSYTLSSSSITQNLPYLAPWVIPTYALLAVWNLASIALLWMWKKLGFYMIIASTVVVASINGMILGSLGVAATVFALIGIGILYLAMRPVWNSFK